MKDNDSDIDEESRLVRCLRTKYVLFLKFYLYFINEYLIFIELERNIAH